MEPLVEVPSQFLCPISLDIMRDPVTLPTGITYDRHNIERWIFSSRRHTCPVTNVPLLADPDITPNHTLRRLIQSWCSANASFGIQRFPTPRPPVDKAQISALLRDAAAGANTSVRALVKLRSIVSESERNRQCAESCGAVDVLTSILINHSAYSSSSSSSSSSPVEEDFKVGAESSATSASDEALNILHSMQLSEQGLLDLVSKNDEFVDSLTAILSRANYQSRAYATLLLRSIVTVISPFQLLAMKEELFVEMVRVLKDQVSYQATKAALRALAWLCSWGTNPVKAIDAGALPVLVEMLLDEPEKAACETILLVIDLMCGSPEGRVEIADHAAGIAVVAKKIVRVSPVATERAVRILHSVSKYSAPPAVVQEMMEVGAVSKLCMLLQMDCDLKIKEKVKEILRLHSKVWKHSTCLAPQLRASYPSD